MMISPHPIMAIKYTVVPTNTPPFDRVDALSRYCFGLIYDRWKLSARPDTWHKWADDRGIYCTYDQRDLAAELGVTLPTVRRCLDRLADAQLLNKDRSDKYGACRYYPTAWARMAMGVPDGYAEYLRSKDTTRGA